ncbi:Coadhesin [Echinococcus granulosus]|uniref:Hemicentin 1 n=2 Tax=Echinococcus granulosus TaxID=6210 RepID=A0A068WML4_ECHGR|nr:Coadhesin [Echinococcus granulosus]CDS18868.1 hemicentin 1 [Echinococcus granulosus]
MFRTRFYLSVFCLLALCCLPRVSPAGFNWGAWSAWPVACSQTCGEGRRCRNRQCLDGFGGVRNVSQCVGSGEECMTCVINSKCPRQPDWSSWSPWSDCFLSESKKKPKPDAQGCLPGTRFRTRLCNNPPPELGPNALQCSGLSREVKSCLYGCHDTQMDDFNLKARVKQQVQKDHLVTRVQRKFPKDHADVVLVRTAGDSALLDCNTEAYRFAKETLEEKTISLSQINLPTRKVSIFWQLGGRTIATGSNYVTTKERRIILPIKELVDEETQWISGLKRTSPVVEGTKLLLSGLKPHDTGLYTCHIKIGSEEWLATFYSLIVLGQQFSAPAQMPFYLHSNIGEWSAFEKGQVLWYDAARIQWNLNGEPIFNDLAIRPKARIRLIPHLRNEMQGHWDCHLIVPRPDAPTTQASRNISFSGWFLINSFFLRVTSRPPSLWELAARPPRVARLRLVALIVTVASLGLLVALILTIWAVQRWVQRTPRLDQLESAVEEVIEDRTRLFIGAQQKARQRRRLLMPFVRAEMKEIDKVRMKPPPDESTSTLLTSPGNQLTIDRGISENLQVLTQQLGDINQEKETKGIKGFFQKLKLEKQRNQGDEPKAKEGNTSESDLSA